MIGAVPTSIYQLAQFTAVGGLKVVMYLVNTITNTNTDTITRHWDHCQNQNTIWDWCSGGFVVTEIFNG